LEKGGEGETHQDEERLRGSRSWGGWDEERQKGKNFWSKQRENVGA